jgi:DNA replication protein DnaC
MTPLDPTQLRARAQALHLNGLLAHWPQVAHEPWVAQLLDWEEAERARRSMERRVRRSSIGRFKPLVDFDWTWPTRCDRQAIEELMGLEFMAEAANVILFGPNGVGKSTLARNLAYQALIGGRTVLFASAGALLGELAAIDSASALSRRLRHYAGFDLLCVDLCGALSYVEFGEAAIGNSAALTSHN